ncbi:GIP [Symbiodinium sp. CCMP2592]|nr:GIP [Symbiodinium sp. CCMP2592]
MSGDSSGPPPGFGPDDAGSQEPPAAPPHPSFGAGDRQSSSGDRPVGGLSSDPVQDRRVLQSAPDVPGQAEQEGPAHREREAQDESEPTYDPSLHCWNSGTNHEQPHDSTHHEWNAGAAADRAWGDGRAHRGDWSDRADASAGYGRRSSWETTTVNSSGDGWTRRLREEDPWASGGDPWQREPKKFWGHGGRDGHERRDRGRDSGGFRGGPWADGRDLGPGGDDSAHHRGLFWDDSRDQLYQGRDSGGFLGGPWADGRDRFQGLRDSGYHGRWHDVSGPGSEPGSWQDGRSYDVHTDWGAQGGHGGWRDSDDGYKGSRPTERMTVPTFSAEDNDDLGNSARSYLRQIEVWKRITRVPVNQLGLVLYQHLSGKAWIAAEELSVSKLSTSEGLGYFTSWVSARFLDLEVARIGRAFSDFFRKLRRKPSQTIREYNTEYDRLHGRLREVGCSLPEECAAWLYLDRLQLEESQELNLLASVGNRYSLHHLQHAAVLHDRGQRKPWEGATGKGRRTNYAHMTNHDSSDEDEDGENYEDGIPEEVAEALMTYQSAKEKYRAQQRSRGTVDGNKNGKDETSGGDSRPSVGDRDSKLKAMKARSFCGGCGRKGHWHKDDACPLNRNGGAKADVPKNVAMTNAMPADVYALKHVSDNLMGVADTACARTVAGTQWLQSYTNILAEIGEKPLLKKECEAYRFGTGRVHYSSFYVIVGFKLGGYNIHVRTSIITGDIPLLLSKTVLGKLGMIYDVQQGKADFRAIGLRDYELASTASGHPAIPICPVGLSAGETPDLQVEDLRLQQIGQYMEVYAVAHCGPQPPKYSGIFYEKKLDPGTRDMLSGDRLSLAVFQSWWEKSCIDRDFWVETPSTWVRVHMVPRRATFNPSTWRTGSTVLRDMLVANIGATRMTESVCCRTGKWIESTVDQWRPGQVDQHVFPLLWVGRTVFYKLPSPGPPHCDPRGSDGSSAMLREERALISEALRVGATVHHTWSVQELRATIREHIDTYTEKTASQRMRGLSSMTMPELTKKATEMGVHVPEKVTKGALLKLIRDTVSSPGDTIMTIGRWKGSLYTEIPDSYGSWAAAEVARSPNSSPELVMYARWWSEQQKNKAGRAKIPVEDEDYEGTISSRRSPTSTGTSWEEVTVTPSKGYRQSSGKGNTKTTPKRMSPELLEKTEGKMDSQADAAVLQEIADLETKLAILKDKARGSSEGIKTSTLSYATGVDQPDHGVYTTRHHEHHDQAQRRVRFLSPSDGPEGRLRDDNGPPRPVRHGDDSCEWGDYSFENCQRVLEDLVFGRGKPTMRAVQFAEEDGANYDCVTYGLFTHGGVHGLTRATKDDDALVRFLNHFGREHLGDEAKWTSISVTKNVAIGIHKDSNNLRGSLNYCATVGWKRDKGGWLPGRYHRTKETFFAFDPFKKHCSTTWEGTRWCITYHTVRGITEVGSEIKKFLRAAGFPVAHHKNYKKEPASKPPPKKSVRNGIMNSAGKLSVLMATLLAATGTYLNETIGPPADYDPIVMMELGGYEGTSEAVELGKAVIEPLIWTDLLDPKTQENAYYFVTGASPRELRIHPDEMPGALETFVKGLIGEQIREGGEVVLRGHRAHELAKGYENYLKYKTTDNEDAWVILGKSKDGGRTTGEGPRRHDVCVVGAEDSREERAPRLDGSGITFDESVPGILQSSLRRLHQNLGHPRSEDLCRHLRLAGCEPHVVKAVKGMRCETCEATKHAQIARPTALPRLLDFNTCVGVDIFYCHDINDVRHAFLAIVDWATTYQVAVLLEAETGPDIERAFNDHWLGVFGPPTTVSLDLDGKVQAGLARLCDWHSIKVKDVAAQAKWQGGVTERQIGWFKGIWERVVHELNVGSEEAALAASMVCAAKNDLRRRCGHSPSQWVLGRSPRVPEDLCDPDSGEAATWDLTKDSKFQRATAMRTSARIAFHQAQGDDRLRRGLLHRARTTKAVYEIGDSVHYWNQPKDRRRPHWAGPAVVVGKQGGSYWVSRGGRCRLTAPEHLRCSGPEEVGEYLTMKNVQSEVTKLLAMDIDDPDTYAEETINEDYRESVKRKGDEGDHLSDYEYSDYEGDEVILDPEGDHEMPDEPQAIEHVLPSRRMRKKGKPPSPEDADEVLLTNKPLTKRGHAKRQEKELKWEEIPDHAKNLFKEAEKVQWEEHLSYDALEPLDLEQSSLVRQTVPPDRILPCRWAYRDKNWAARQATTAAGEQPAWRCKSRLVIGGHRDPDLGVETLSTDAPTLSRPGFLCLMQLLANGLEAEDKWMVAAGDIQCAFLTGGYLSRGEDLFLHQPPRDFCPGNW